MEGGISHHNFITAESLLRLFSRHQSLSVLRSKADAEGETSPETQAPVWEGAAPDPLRSGPAG